MDKQTRKKLIPSKMTAAWKEATWTFVLSRLIILLISYIGVANFQVYNVGLPYITTANCSSNITCFLQSWWRWDAVWYVEIAHYGYQHYSRTTAFFPLFP